VAVSGITVSGTASPTSGSATSIPGLK
jgi:hypothetical protein